VSRLWDSLTVVFLGVLLLVVMAVVGGCGWLSVVLAYAAMMSGIGGILFPFFCGLLAGICFIVLCGLLGTIGTALRAEWASL
jgi:hypothetical protein